MRKATVSAKKAGINSSSWSCATRAAAGITAIALACLSKLSFVPLLLATHVPFVFMSHPPLSFLSSAVETSMILSPGNATPVVSRRVCLSTYPSVSLVIASRRGWQHRRHSSIERRSSLLLRARTVGAASELASCLNVCWSPMRRCISSRR